MLIYILKFSACLSVFMVFYKLFLEKENMHFFKRFYLIFGVIVSFIIPLITFTEYVVIASEVQSVIINDLAINSDSNYLTTILWSVYGLGVLVFGILFLKNLIQILFKINRNIKVKNNHFTNVLLQNLVIPHTFFNYIFLNKLKFETRQIPKEVLLHEETHAIQKHSIDILFIEILQVIFWFNPLIYFIKKDIKLNHEFLADKAVLNNGYDTSTYQNTLLAYSSNVKEPLPIVIGMANTINYSLIKKRFTVMKTQTSKKGIWFRSILFLPLLAILLFSFSTKVIVVEEKNQTELEKIIEQDNATKEQIKEYNALAKKYNEMPKDKMVIKRSELERLKYLYDLMSERQRKSAQLFPNIPPPPAPAPPDAPKAPKEVRNILAPPPPPLPENPTPAQKKKHEEAIKIHKLQTEKIKQQKNKVKEIKDTKVAAKLKYVEEKTRLRTEKLAYKVSQIAARLEKIRAEKGVMKERELRVAENRKQLQEAKLVYRKAHVTAKADKIKAEKGELIKVRELRDTKDRLQLQEEKLVYKEAQLALRLEKVKIVKERKKRTSEERKSLKEEKKAYKKSQAKEKTLKKKSNKKENE